MLLVRLTTDGLATLSLRERLFTNPCEHWLANVESVRDDQPEPEIRLQRRFTVTHLTFCEATSREGDCHPVGEAWGFKCGSEPVARS